MHPTHRTSDGSYCNCPWGPGVADPYVSNKDREVVGSKEAMWHEASKIEWLRDPEKNPHLATPEAQQFLDALEHQLGPKYDKLFPWLVNESQIGKPADQRKPRLLYERFSPQGSWQETDPFVFIDEEGRRSGLGPEDLQTIQEWMKYQSSTGNKGIDIMQHRIGDAVNEARKWDQGGEIVHEFSPEDAANAGVGEFPHAAWVGNPEAPIDRANFPFPQELAGWKMVRLRDRRDLRREGRMMRHCIGNSSQRYDQKLDDGQSAFFSLRDPQNKPYGTLEVGKTRQNYFKCPSCGKFTTGEWHEDHHHDSNQWLKCDNCQTVLGSKHDYYGDRTEPDELEPGVQEFPIDLNHKSVRNRPNPSMTRVDQMYGHDNNAVRPPATELINQWLTKLGHPRKEATSYSPGRDMDPWWQDQYEVQGPSTLDDYLEHARGEYYANHMPDDYRRAQRDANRGWQLTEPRLVQHPPDLEAVFKDTTNPSNLDPERLDNFFNRAQETGDAPFFLQRAQEWLTQPQAFTNPALGTNEPYVARNLLYQLDKHLPQDPQTGERVPRDEFNMRYPELRSNKPQVQPRVTPKTAPFGEYTGPLHMRDRYDDAITLPYGPGRGERFEMFDPHPQAQLPQQDPELFDSYDQYDPGYHRRNFPQSVPRRPEGWEDYLDESPGEPQEAERQDQVFGPPDVRFHQRSLPGWEDTRLTPDFHAPAAYPLTQQPLEQYEQGEQQGSLLPPAWFIDTGQQEDRRYRMGNPMPTGLPQDLFPSDRFHYLRPPVQEAQWDDPYAQGQVPMWGQPQVMPDINAMPRDEPPPRDSNQHAVYVYTRDNNRYRVSDWGPHDQIHRTFDYHDRVHRTNAYDREAPNSYIEGPNGYEEIGHYGVRSADDPNWNNAAPARVIHPGAEPFEPGMYSPINTQQPFNQNRTVYDERDDMYNNNVLPHDRPRGRWNAKTKQSGPWTHNEGQGGRGRPQPDPQHGHGIHDIPVHEGTPHLQGRIVEHTHPDHLKLPDHEWRRPVVYDRGEDRLYVGQHSMEHTDMMKHFHKPSPWGDDFTGAEGYVPGYIDTDAHTGDGGLYFFLDPKDIPDADHFHDWVEKQHGVRARRGVQEENMDELPWDSIEASYHPRQDDEWAAEDEPVFSAVIPEPRWRT